MSDTSPKKIDDGGPAFPTALVHWNGAMIDRGPGLSLRDWFAGQALSAIGGYAVQPDGGDDSATAALAYRIADAMLAARGGAA